MALPQAASPPQVCLISGANTIRKPRDHLRNGPRNGSMEGGRTWKLVHSMRYFFTPGKNPVGIVEKCGPEVRERAVGDVVAAYPELGSYSQYLSGFVRI